MKYLSAIILAITIFNGCTSPAYQARFYRANQWPVSNQNPTTQDTLRAIADAQLDAQADSRPHITWMCIGGGCSLFGVGAAYVYREGVPVHRLVMLENESDAYILTYTAVYIEEANRLRFKDAAIGWVIGTALFASFLLTANTIQPHWIEDAKWL